MIKIMTGGPHIHRVADSSLCWRLAHEGGRGKAKLRGRERGKKGKEKQTDLLTEIKNNADETGISPLPMSPRSNYMP